MIVNPTIAGALTVAACFAATKQFTLNFRDNRRIELAISQLHQLKQLIELCQQHRGISSAVCAGNASLTGKLTFLQHQIDQFILDSRHNEIQTLPQWLSFVDHWPRLKQQVVDRKLSSHQVIRQHNAMIEGQLALFDDLSRLHNLHHFMLDNITRLSGICLDTLRAAEILGQMRAVGTSLCARSQAGGAETMMLTFQRLTASGRIAELLREIAGIRNKDLQVILAEQTTQIERETDLLLQTIDQQVLIEGGLTLSADDYFKTATRAIDTVLNVFSLIINYAADNHAKLN
ncbi:nitrate- and nitrite sensing domain-containing protein [Methylophaga pinxianii]|uniref:nitrate- and nitrite sensing domain-containing protein n=1 Tax=Methylophaga pinxianii TaxID=2881052 RepID=UPI001CF3DF8C|nr:nitrate- and nitrite sensing domain-containing protein [Methylophaga pinxianii]MCB2425839.1 nitrate- and nitrite sensing domain-containing protein [Methylophaga pinxianii]UPH46966.1 nitrate- and nitrite sensing domain-containing protein [Methylophaga pinxianii]